MVTAQLSHCVSRALSCGERTICPTWIGRREPATPRVPSNGGDEEVGAGALEHHLDRILHRGTLGVPLLLVVALQAFNLLLVSKEALGFLPQRDELARLFG